MGISRNLSIEGSFKSGLTFVEHFFGQVDLVNFFLTEKPFELFSWRQFFDLHQNQKPKSLFCPKNKKKFSAFQLVGVDQQVSGTFRNFSGNYFTRHWFGQMNGHLYSSPYRELVCLIN